jgi:hypothetical protein
MKILTLDDIGFELDALPEEVDDMRFSIFDNSDSSNPDYYFIPLIFLESFNAPALVLRIGEHTIKMPVDWQILIGEPDLGDLEAFQFNPLSSFSPSFLDIEILDIYQEVKWYAPKLKNGQYLCVPLTSEEQPPCIYFVKDVSRNAEVINYHHAF